MSRVLFSILKAISTIAIYVLGIYFILLYIESDHPRNNVTLSDQGAGGGAAIAIFGFLLIVIWSVVWYSLVYKLKAIYVRQKNTIDVRLTSYVLKFPIISFALILLYFFVICPFYFYLNKKIMLNRQENLLEYLKNGQTIKALETIQNKKIENFHYADGTSLLYNASVYNETIFDTLLNRFNIIDRNLSVNYNQKQGCVFCNLKTERVALNAIEKMDFDLRYWNYGSGKAAFCSNNDLLIFFIKKKWHKCIEKYLEKCRERIEGDRFKPYNCQIKFYDNKLKLYDYKSVDPYHYAPDLLTRIILDKYEFQK